MSQQALGEFAPVSPSCSRVLVAEDGELTRQLVQFLLVSCGYQVDEAENGLAALTLIEQWHYDLILMDCMMPLMDGYEACRRLREHEIASGAKRTPVIAFTANTQEQDRSMCLTVGMDDYLIKPFTAEQLICAVARWIPSHDAVNVNGDEPKNLL